MLLICFNSYKYSLTQKWFTFVCQSGDEEELQTIRDEEVKVRNLIQETLVKSDELCVSIGLISV